MLRRRLLYNKGGIDYSSAGVGDILCSDMSFVSATNFASSGKTAIGVIFRITSSSVSAIALSVVAGKYFGGSGTDIPTLQNITTGGESEFDGKGNTDKIIEALGNSTNLSAGWCRAFYTQGTNAGDWYLPAMGEWFAIAANQYTIEASFSVCGGTRFPTSGTMCVTASSEYDSLYCNVYDFRYSCKSGVSKTSTTEITRAAIQITF